MNFFYIEGDDINTGVKRTISISNSSPVSLEPHTVPQYTVVTTNTVRLLVRKSIAEVEKLFKNLSP